MEETTLTELLGLENTYRPLQDDRSTLEALDFNWIISQLILLKNSSSYDFYYSSNLQHLQKHLPGKHNQKDHGLRGQAAVGPRGEYDPKDTSSRGTASTSSGNKVPWTRKTNDPVLNRVEHTISNFLQLESRWNGQLSYQKLPANVGGVANWDGSISIHVDLKKNKVEFAHTLAHELIHHHSRGSDAAQHMRAKEFMKHRGYEEGPTEAMTRIMRPTILRAMNINPNDPKVREYFRQRDADHPYNRYINHLESARSLTRMSPTNFYRSLLQMPLKDRHAYIERLLSEARRSNPQVTERAKSHVLSNLIYGLGLGLVGVGFIEGLGGEEEEDENE